MMVAMWGELQERSNGSFGISDPQEDERSERKVRGWKRE